MEISQFARQVLFGTSLSDKLHRPAQFSDQRPQGLRQLPTRPGRPRGLELVEGGAKHSFPTAAALHRPQARGIAFHFFANHELLALELMAVALLRFDDAPSDFRRQVATAMLEEQEHLSAYLGQMPDYGVEFGELSVSSFFWNALAGMASPMEYIAGMSLTFEQANLDFALRFRKAFTAVEDHRGASILQKVLDDEIGHVRLGVQWMRRLGDPHQSDYERHESALRWPLHMARAKGQLDPEVEPRRKAGLSAEYIQKLARLRASKGRAPTIWAFNPSYESEIAGKGVSGGAAIEADLAFLLSYLSSPGDIVGVVQPPSPGYIRQMQAFRLAEAQLLCVPPWPGAWSRPASGPSKLAELRSWGPSPAAAKVFASYLKASTMPLPSAAARQASVRLSNKCEAGRLEAEFFEQLAPHLQARVFCRGWAFRDLARLQARIHGEFEESGAEVVLKAPWASAGQQQQRVQQGTMTLAQRNWAKKILARSQEIRVEPWLCRGLDLSARFSAMQEGRRVLSGCTRMLCDARGAFMGHLLCPLGAGLERSMIDFIYHGGKEARWIPGLFRQLHAWIASKEAYCEYQGPLSIDAFVIRGPQGPQLRMMSEINARYTMGHVADALAKKVLRSSSAIWLLLGVQDARAGGFDTLCALGEALPSEIIRQGEQIERGRLWTNDPALAQTRLSVLLVDRDLGSALGRLGPQLAAHLAQKIRAGSVDFLGAEPGRGSVSDEQRRS